MTIIHVLEPFATGINTFIHELVFSMPNYKHIIIHGERKDNRKIEEIKTEYQNKVTFIKWNNAHREIHLVKDIKAYFELKKILKKLEFDILHLHSSKAGILGRIIGFFAGYKNIVYTPNAASFMRTDISNRQRNIYIFLEKLANKITCEIISSSESEYDEFDAIGIKTRIIENGATLQHKKKYQEKDDSCFTIVFCGKITIQKNPELFNEIALHYENDASIRFIWVGEGELKELLTSTNIHITGWCSKEKVYQALNQSHIYLSTSLWEGLSLATIEAMAFGLPLVLHKCNGNKDIVKETENGYLFSNLEEAIVYIELLKNNSEKYSIISQNSLARYNEYYGNNRCGLEYKDLYLNMIEHNA